ncbi:MAG: hypothetical protein A4E28_01109 [Methanocella sp. PtaU1.Bin125]|nr:MAG: hypothetical protein A4E28_01109 [Methanocella sp. PtaU1.Bin125]
MNPRQILVAIAALALVAAVSGCICCCGIDGMFSKLKGSVNKINFPDKINLNGKAFDKLYSKEYLDPESVKAGLKNFANKLGYETGGDISSSIDSLIDASGIRQYKSFKYSDGTVKGVFGGLVGKTDSPVQTAVGFEAMKAAANAALPTANDPDENTGRVQDISSGGSSSIGDGGERYISQVDGMDCYFVCVKYSNTYVMAYSFESFAAAEAAAQMAIKQIDEAAAS